MKKTLILIIAVITVFAACKKKQSSASCYLCQRYVLINSTYPVLAKPLAYLGTDTLCDRTDGWMSLYESQHTYNDTLQNSHDTLTFAVHSVQCGLE